jgi:hypothetical protein
LSAESQAEEKNKEGMYIYYFLHYLLLDSLNGYRAAEKVYILSESIKSVIPEGAKRLSGIQKKIIVYWIPDLDFVSSGMTFGAFSRLFQQPASVFNNTLDRIEV